MFGLVDCNNFYASCQRVFDPSLNNKPVVVLSNNDGCIIARSNEAKALGIQMGEPYFKVKEKIELNKVAVFSSNYTLYGDLSSRVMTILSHLAPQSEVYSIDECFLDFSSWSDYNASTSAVNLLEHGKFIKERVKQWTGIPVSIGLAPTKTLAKAANKVAKKAEGVKLLREADEIDSILSTTEVGDLWGIGRQYAKFLKSHNIHTALQLKNTTDGFVKKYLTVVGLRLVYELRGVPCLPIEMVAKPKKAICTSRGFGHPVTELKHLEEAVSTFAANCAFKLRKQGSAARMLTVFIHTDNFNASQPQYSNSRQVKLLVASDNTAEIISYALAGLRAIYWEGFEYKKAGIIVTSIVPKTQVQQSLFDSSDRAKHGKVMDVLDIINQKMGKHTVKFAVQGMIKGAAWQQKQKNLSPCYTTRWDQVLKAR